jgi:hypothetical protein
MAARALVLVASVILAPLSAVAQKAPVDPRWAPYLGCWQLRMENTTDGIADLVAAAARVAPDNQRTDDVMICITPSDQPMAVAQQTVLNGESVLDEIVATDGTERTSEDAGCKSTRRAEWSTSGRQLFTRGTMACAGQPERRISGLSMMVAGPTWVDVQMVEVSDRRSVRVRRYGLSREQIRASGRAGTPAAGSATLARWSMDEVKEASRKTAPEVLQAALIEVGNKFPLSSKRLVELTRAGVPGSVIDVMVALTFPEKFEIERPTYASSGGGGWSGPYGGGPWVDPWAVASQYGWLSMYAPFGYQYYGMYDPRYGPGWGWVPVTGPIVPSQPDVEARVVNGAGYTRVRPREPIPSPVTAGGIVDRSGGSSGGSSSGGSGSGGVSTGGHSSGGSAGGSGGGSGRTAVPRPPGGSR